jgi:HK97 family phage major capsid protein
MNNWLKKMKDAQAKQEELLAAAKTDGRAFTDEEQTEFDNAQKDFDNAKKMADAEAALEAQKKTVKEPSNGSEPNGSEPHIDVVSNPPKWSNLAEAMIAVKRAANGQGVDDRLISNAATGHSVGNPADGGFDVGAEVIAGIKSKIDTVAVLANKCEKQPIGPGKNRIEWVEVKENSRVSGSRHGGLTGYWLAEAGTVTASQVELQKRELALEKVAALFYATDELLEDSVAMAAMATSKAGQELSYLLDEAILSGAGAGRPLGLLNSPALVSVAKESGQKASTVVAENIIKMYSRMTPSAMAGAEWYINPDVLPELQTMGISTANGTIPVYMPANGFSQAPYGTLFGKPIVPIEQAEALGTVGDIVFANLKEYMLIEKGGIQTASSIHVQFLTAQQVFRFILRVNGMPKWTNTLTSAKGSTTRSPYVALATRS